MLCRYPRYMNFMDERATFTFSPTVQHREKYCDFGNLPVFRSQLRNAYFCPMNCINNILACHSLSPSSHVTGRISELSLGRAWYRLRPTRVASRCRRQLLCWLHSTYISMFLSAASDMLSLLQLRYPGSTWFALNFMQP